MEIGHGVGKRGRGSMGGREEGVALCPRRDIKKGKGVCFRAKKGFVRREGEETLVGILRILAKGTTKKKNLKRRDGEGKKGGEACGKNRKRGDNSLLPRYREEKVDNKKNETGSSPIK